MDVWVDWSVGLGVIGCGCDWVLGVIGIGCDVSVWMCSGFFAEKL